MKKVLIAFLALLLLVSFTSCDTQKKIDDAVAAREQLYIDYSDTYRTINTYSIGSFNVTDGTYDLSKFDFSTSSSTTNYSDLEKIVMQLISGDLYSKDDYKGVTGLSFKYVKCEGKVTVKSSEDEEKDTSSYECKIEGVKISYSYSYDSKTYTDATLTLDCEYSYSKSTDTKADTVTESTVVKSLSINGETKKSIENVTVRNETTYKSKVTKATCGGVALNIELLGY